MYLYLLKQITFVYMCMCTNLYVLNSNVFEQVGFCMYANTYSICVSVFLCLNRDNCRILYQQNCMTRQLSVNFNKALKKLKKNIIKVFCVKNLHLCEYFI